MRTLWMAAVLMAAACLMVACSSKKSGAEMAGVLGKAASAVTPSDPGVMFSKMVEAQAAATSYRMKMVNEMAGAQMEIDADVVCPDKTHTVIKQSGQTLSEQYLVGGMMYMKVGGSVMKQPAAHGSSDAIACHTADATGKNAFDDPFKAAQEWQQNKDKTKITKGATSVVEGSPCQVWNMTYSDAQNQTSQVEYCIGITDNLPRHVVVSSSAHPGKMDITFWDWNGKDITVTPPAS